MPFKITYMSPETITSPPSKCNIVIVIINNFHTKLLNLSLPETFESVVASDAFFPFADGINTLIKAGVKTIIQPGGSIKDELSINFCNEKNISMVFTGYRHFKH